MKDLIFVASRDLRYMLRQRETLLWVFAMPVLFFWFIGTVTGGFGGRDPNAPTPIALVAPDDAGFLADEVARRLTEDSYRVQRAAVRDSVSGYSRKLTLPAAFTADRRHSRIAAANTAAIGSAGLAPTRS